MAETDLLIHADGVVITGEVKTSNALHTSGKERVKAAPSSVQAMIDALAAYAWTTPAHQPRLRLLEGIGSTSVMSTYVAY